MKELICEHCNNYFKSNRKKKFCSEYCCNKYHSLKRGIKQFEIESIDGEIWKEIKGYEGFYKISNFGRIKSDNRVLSCGKRLNGKILKGSKCKNEYFRILLYRDGKHKSFKCHRLVAIHFLENTFSKDCINHIDGNKLNNRVSNLEWCTYKENNQHAYSVLNKKGAWLGKKGILHPRTKKQ